MKVNLKIIPYLLVNMVSFYILPMVTGSAMLVLPIVIQLICFATAIFCGVKNSFNLIYPLAAALLFIPTIFIYYNESAAFYIAVYGVVALVGNLVGTIFYKLKRTKSI